MLDRKTYNTYSIRMAKNTLKKDRWTITFDHILKDQVQKEARKLRIYPVQLLESIVREKLNPYGLQNVRDSVTYVQSIRQKSSLKNDKDFLLDLKSWQKR